jgi:hypothetical protein
LELSDGGNGVVCGKVVDLSLGISDESIKPQFVAVVLNLHDFLFYGVNRVSVVYIDRVAARDVKGGNVGSDKFLVYRVDLEGSLRNNRKNFGREHFGFVGWFWLCGLRMFEGSFIVDSSQQQLEEENELKRFFKFVYGVSTL